MSVKEITPSLVEKKKAIILTHSNEKGGVGKTTVEFHQAYRLAELGHRVLIVDVDGQRNMSNLMLGEKAVELIERSGFTAADIFSENVDMAKVRVYQSPLHENIHVLPAHKSKIAGVMASGATESVKMVGNPKKVLDRLDYDFILIDTPPSLGVTQVAALCAVDYLFVPVKIDDFSNQGVISLLQTVNAITKQLNATVKLACVYINLFRKPTVRKGENPYEDTLKEIVDRYKKYLLPRYIPDSQTINEARMGRKPVWVQPPNGNAAAVGREMKKAIDQMNAVFFDKGGK